MSTARMVLVLLGLGALFGFVSAGGNGSCIPVEPLESVCMDDADCDDGDPRTVDRCGLESICVAEPYGCSSPALDESGVCPLAEGYEAQCRLYAPSNNKGGWYQGICSYTPVSGCQSEAECNTAGGEHFFCYYGQCLLNYHDSCVSLETAQYLAMGTPCVDWGYSWPYLGFCDANGQCAVEGRAECHPADATCEDSDAAIESWCSPRTFDCQNTRYECYTDLDCPVGTGCLDLPPAWCDDEQGVCQLQQSYCYEPVESCVDMVDGFPCGQANQIGQCLSGQCVQFYIPQCWFNSDCADGEVCFHNVCYGGCLEDADCADGQYCDPPDGGGCTPEGCFPGQGVGECHNLPCEVRCPAWMECRGVGCYDIPCETSLDCPEVPDGIGEVVCHSTLHFCYVPSPTLPISCEHDGHCPAEMYCGSSTGYCEPRAQFSVSKAYDSPSGQIRPGMDVVLARWSVYASGIERHLQLLSWEELVVIHGVENPTEQIGSCRLVNAWVYGGSLGSSEVVFDDDGNVGRVSFSWSTLFWAVHSGGVYELRCDLPGPFPQNAAIMTGFENPNTAIHLVGIETGSRAQVSPSSPLWGNPLVF